jgi:TRAP-type C4-dicarboxylate transport system permease small subunit
VVPDEPAQADGLQQPDESVELIEIPEHAVELGEDPTVEILPASGPLRTVLHLIGLAEQAVGVLLLLVILVLVIVQVGQRYVPGTGLPATGELARLAMVWATFVLAGYLMAHDRHIAIHVVDYFLPVRVLGAVQLLGHLVVTITCLALAYATWDLIARDRGVVTSAAQIPETLVYGVALAGFVLTFIRAVVTVAVLDLPEIAGKRGRTT